MNSVNKTLYIPLYGKAKVSKKGIILHDPKAEEIWEKEAFPLKGKAKSKWLCYYMGMRSAVFDRFLQAKMKEVPDALVLHVGCGMDGRIIRVGEQGHKWYDVDFPAVVAERRKYYRETENYHMLTGDLREKEWLTDIPGGKAIVIMEGVSMYMENEQLQDLFSRLQEHFEQVFLLADFYTVFAAKASKYKNPINEVGVRELYGVDDTHILEVGRIKCVREHEMTPIDMINQLTGFERSFFKMMFGGKMAKKIYRLYEFDTDRICN